MSKFWAMFLLIHLTVFGFYIGGWLGKKIFSYYAVFCFTSTMLLKIITVTMQRRKDSHIVS